MRKNTLFPAVFSIVVVLLQTLSTVSPAAAYQINLDYSSAKTWDTVTPKGIYHQAIIFLDASPEILNKVRSVKYELEDSFYQNELEVRSPEHNFALEVQTLEHFNVVANIHFIDGKNLTLSKYIMLNVHPPKLKSVHPVRFIHIVTKENSKGGKKTFNIQLRVEGPDNDLSQIDHVDYYFPPSSPQRIVKVSTGPDFPYDMEITEELSLQAYIYFKDGTVMELVRFVYFKYY